MTYPPPPGYPAPEPYPGSGQQPQYWQESPKSKGLAIAALVCGILAAISFCTIVGGILFGLLAVVLGAIAAVKVRRGTGGGGVMAVIGLILGAVAIVAAIVFGVFFWNFWEDSGGKDFTDCVSRAGGDQQQIAQCEDQFNQRLEDQFGVTMQPPVPTN
ncbi:MULTISPECIES: DUF4190 domain-containing protein [Nocardia]|uniref:DUF4190 domain-containing protein n=1 Tax=Nocardia TaxID=1817 RepID=UPI00189504A5|nr:MULTISPECIES: DUF4190 domain-containing protein [Nocardia]MBF6350136.1 DUF4190 domain-containing protein [Nocardia flavorosea]